MMVSIWIEDKSKKEIIEAVKNHNEEDPLYDGHHIDEFYIDRSSGAIEGYISVGPIGVGIDIPFEDWFAQFLKFGSFEKLEYFLAENQERVKAVQMVLKNIRCLQGSVNK